MAKTPLFQGSRTAIVTPYTEQGIDYEHVWKNLDFQYKNGTAAIVVCGTTGEAATQNADEHNELVRFTVQAVAGRMKVIAGGRQQQHANGPAICRERESRGCGRYPHGHALLQRNEPAGRDLGGEL